ncbi:MAG TPA: restriction endonuclease, partial [Polyangiaceae bacterium]|nr:restriction endonuclease [Polyangiaceae bacterium]
DLDPSASARIISYGEAIDIWERSPLLGHGVTGTHFIDSQYFRQLAETAQRRGRLSGDLQQLQSQIAASVRADNLRRAASGQRPRFRFVAGRIALTDWLLNSDLSRLEQEAIAAVERYREAARKAFVRKLQELPGHAFVELVLLVFERLGFHHIRAIRRAGIPGQESHFTALHDTGVGQLPSALVIRRDGREIGRERVAEFRGAFHHFGSADAGWLVTAGSVLSGAREEAAASNAATVALYDGSGIARLCEQHDIAVMRATLPICIPDLDVLEALRSS